MAQFAFICVVLSVIDLKFGYSDLIHEYITYPVYHIINFPSKMIHNMGLVFQSNQDLIEQNEGLKAQIIDLKADQKIYENAKRENEVLRELLSSSGKVKAEFTHAEILAISNNIARKIVIINKGSSDDVYDGQAVVDAYGVFGHVIKAHKFTSSVLLITDKDSYVPVQNSKEYWCNWFW